MIETTFDADAVAMPKGLEEEIGSMTPNSERIFIADILIDGGVAHEEFKLTFSNEY